MSLLVNVLILVAGFILLIKGADYFVEGASGIAERFGIPQIIIGLTIVAFGTSAPEAAISISAAVRGVDGIAVGNILGSNIMNILLILGLTSCFVPLAVQKNTVKFEIPYLLFVTVVLVVMGSVMKQLGLVQGMILWVLFILLFVYLISSAISGMKKSKQAEDSKSIEPKKKVRKAWVLILMTLLGMAAIIYGSDLTVDSASAIAKFFGMSDRVIGLTVVAFGTSLPELITSLTAARRGNADIAVGNIVGSNLFNILFILGTTSLIKAIPYSNAYLLDGIVCIVAVVFLFLFSFRKKKLGRLGGIIMLVTYFAYFAYIFIA